MRQIFISAGEASGDRYGAPVVNALSRHDPDIRFFGCGGPALEAAGVELRHRSDRLAVTGLSEVRHVAGAALAMLVDCTRELWRRRPSLAILVDYPGINLRLAAICQRLKIPVLYYVAPQRWAWMGWRSGALARLVDHLAVTLPFEERFFRERGVNTTFVGHPLIPGPVCVAAGGAPEAARPLRNQLGLAESEGTGLVGLFPGSRPQEIRAHVPILREFARREPATEMVLAVGDPSMDGLCRQLAPEIARWETARVLHQAGVAFSCAGSVTLELGLHGVPTVVFYRMAKLSYALARRWVKVPHIALPNLIMGRPIMPELIQDGMTPRGLSGQLGLCRCPSWRAGQTAALEGLQRQLGHGDTATKVATLALNLMQ